MAINIRSLSRLPLGLVGITFVVLAAILLFLAWTSIDLVERTLVPELEAKSTAVADSMSGPLARALGSGVPLAELVGLQDFVAAAVADHPEVQTVRLLDVQGNPVFSGSFPRQGAAATADSLLTETHPVGPELAPLALLEVGIDVGYVAGRLSEIYGDLGVIAVVCIFLTFEVLLIVIALTIGDPVRRLAVLMEQGEKGVFTYTAPGESSDEIGRFVRAFNSMVGRQHERFRNVAGAMGNLGGRGDLQLQSLIEDLRPALGNTDAGPTVLREARPTDVRLPLFVFFFSTELCRSFLPIYARDLYEPIPWLSYELAIALPVAAYLFLVAVLTPFAGSLSDKLGNRRLFVLGLVPTTLGLAMTAFATNLFELTLYRGVNAVGFALTTIAALSYIARTTTPRTRAEGMAIYTAAFVTAGLCGTSIGAILADRLGYDATFLISAGFAVLSAILLYANMHRDGVPLGGRQGLRLGDFGRVLGSGRFLVLIALAAIPTQLLTTGFLFYAVPMMLSAAGIGTSLIGQVMMVYFVVMILLGVPIARLADRLGRHRLFAAAGLVLAGLASALPWLMADMGQITIVTALAVGLVGIAHAMCISSQGAILLQVAEIMGGERQTASISAYRVLERIGAVAGPLVVSTLAGRSSYADAVLAIGAYVLVCGLLFGLAGLGSARRRPAQPLG